MPICVILSSDFNELRHSKHMLCFLLMINHIIGLCSSFEEWYISTLHHTGFTFENLWYFEKLYGSPASVLFSKSDILSWWIVTAIFAAENVLYYILGQFYFKASSSSHFAKKITVSYDYFFNFQTTIAGMDPFRNTMNALCGEPFIYRSCVPVEIVYLFFILYKNSCVW